MIIDIDLLGEDLHVHVSTQGFNPKEQPEQVGVMWIGLCQQINAYMNAHGMPGFDCLTAHEEN